ncbi:MAG TPA: hypothetical protein VN026_18125 [Bacteroidia bacterium]|jgi:hypothetical protein|nr:hypothetical protein [Bacteroidia bacterium]
MPNYTTQYNQDIFSVVNSTVSDLNKLYEFLLINPSCTISAVPVNVSVTYQKSFTPPPPVNVNQPPARPTSKIYLSQHNQNIFDIVSMTSTDYNQLFKLMLDSNFDNVITAPKANTPFIFNPQKITNNILSKLVSDNGIVFNTGMRLEPGEIIEPGNFEFQDGILYEFQDSQLYNFQN